MTDGMDNNEVFSLAECTKPSEWQALNPGNDGQSNVQHIGRSGRGIATDGMDYDDVFSVAKCTAPPEGQALMGWMRRHIFPLQSTQDLQRGPHRLQGMLSTQWADELDSLCGADQFQEGWLIHPAWEHCWRIL